MKCESCEETIETAKCDEGWCMDCTRGLAIGLAAIALSPRPADITINCTRHRVGVHTDDHCRGWVSDK